MPAYEFKNISDITSLWQNLGTFWSEFEDKEVIEAFWESLLESARFLQKDLYYTSLSKTISTLPAVIISEHDYYTVYFSGVNQNTYTLSGFHVFDLPSYTFYINGIYDYSYSGLTNTYISGLLTEGIDYDYVNNNVLSNSIYFYSVPSGYTQTLYIPYTMKLNPILFDVYGAMVGFNPSIWISGYYPPYIESYGNTSDSLTTVSTTANQNYYTFYSLNLKHLIWGLNYYLQQPRTISNLETSIGLVTGLPFIWYSGVVISSTTSGLVMDHGDQFYYRYLKYQSSSLTAVVSGLTDQPLTIYDVGSGLSQFQIISSGVVQVYDYINNSGLIESLITESYQRQSTFAVVIPSGVL